MGIYKVMTQHFGLDTWPFHTSFVVAPSSKKTLEIGESNLTSNSLINYKSNPFCYILCTCWMFRGVKEPCSFVDYESNELFTIIGYTYTCTYTVHVCSAFTCMCTYMYTLYSGKSFEGENFRKFCGLRPRHLRKFSPQNFEHATPTYIALCESFLYEILNSYWSMKGFLPQNFPTTCICYIHTCMCMVLTLPALQWTTATFLSSFFNQMSMSSQNGLISSNGGALWSSNGYVATV